MRFFGWFLSEGGWIEGSGQGKGRGSLYNPGPQEKEDGAALRCSYLNLKLARWKVPSLNFTTSCLQLPSHALALFQM